MLNRRDPDCNLQKRRTWAVRESAQPTLLRVARPKCFKGANSDQPRNMRRTKRRIVVDFEGLLIEIGAHEASVQDGDGAQAVILRVL